MKSVLIISHGTLAEGMFNTLKIFFGSDIPQCDYLVLSPDETAEDFRQKLSDKIDDLDKGDGVIVFADLLGGTPCNQTVLLKDKNIHVFAGMNLAVIMECLSMRMADNFDYKGLEDIGKQAVIDFTNFINNRSKKSK